MPYTGCKWRASSRQVRFLPHCRSHITWARGSSARLTQITIACRDYWQGCRQAHGEPAYCDNASDRLYELLDRGHCAQHRHLGCGAAADADQGMLHDMHP